MALSNDAFMWVADLVRKRSAIQLPSGKEYLVESRLQPLAKEEGFADVTAFVAKARQSNDEARLRRVVEALTTNETSWFRDNNPFLALRQTVLPDLLANRSRPVHLRVWSAACSTGQEPYTLAMVLADALPPSVTFEILATDLSQQVLDRAKLGRYSQLEVNRGLPAPLLVRHFTRSGADWEINADLKSRITFRQHNLLDRPSVVGKMDIILLRNVLIYFDLPTKQAILRRMASVLADDGTLFLGATETTIGVDSSWERIQVGVGSIYHRASAGGSDNTAPRAGAATGTASRLEPARPASPRIPNPVVPAPRVAARPGVLPPRGALS